MNDIREYRQTTSPYEVLVHLNDKIISGELKTFEALKAYAAPLSDGQRARAVLKRAFDLQRQLYWGFFKSVSPASFPKIWASVVMPDRLFPFAGDLKRLMSIPDIYMGLVDIHGYTRFCHRHRHNLSMLDLLDSMIQEDVPRLVAKAGVVSRRAQGDEILLLGAQAADVLEAILMIMEYFSRRRRAPESPAAAKGLAARDTILPVFQVSAGIAGGQKYSALIITRDGDLSGDIVNMASRLQARANKISPDRNRILLTSHVYQKLKAAGGKTGRERLARVDFFNTGTVEFKGMSLAVYDTVFLDAEAYRIAYRDVMEELYESIDKGMWKSKVFEDAMRLAARLAASLPGMATGPKPPERGPSTSDLLARVKAAQEDFLGGRFALAVAGLGALVGDLSLVNGIDDLALEYLRSIHANYTKVLGAFLESLDREVDGHLDTIYSPKAQESFLTLSKHHAMFAQVREAARAKILNPKTIWFRVADEAAPSLGIAIQSKK